MNITWYSSIFAIIYVNQQKWKCVSGIRPGTQGEHITGKPKGENEKRKSHSSFQTDLNTHLLCKVCKIYEPMYADEKYQAKKWKHNSDIVHGIEIPELFSLFSPSHNSKGGRRMSDQMSTRMRFKKWVHCDVPCKKEMHFLYICIFTRVHKLWFYSCVGVEKNV